MSNSRTLALAQTAAVLIMSGAGPVFGQSPPAAFPRQPDVIVRADRPSLPPHLKSTTPERVLGENDVAGYGLDNIGALLGQLARERGDGRNPVYLIDGQRVSGLGDVEAYPTEAINELQVLPQGSAASLGEAADRRVINIVLKSTLNLLVGQASGGGATAGGAESYGADANLTVIRRPQRVNIVLRSRQGALLRESDRAVRQVPGLAVDEGVFRSLRPETDNTDLRVTAATQVGPGVSLSLNTRLFDNRTFALLGRGGDGTGLSQSNVRQGGMIDAQVNANVGDWLIGLSGSYGQDRRLTQTSVDVANAGTRDQRRAIRSIRAEGSIDAVGPVLSLPAGNVSLSLRARAAEDEVIADASRISQFNGEVGWGLQVPVLSASAGPWRTLGSVSFGYDRSSSRTTGSGSFSTEAASFQWLPFPQLQLLGSTISTRSPPEFLSRADPLIATPGIRTFDPIRRETVDVVEIRGGNTDGSARRGRGDLLALRLKPMVSVPLQVRAEYASTESEGGLTAFPSLSETVLTLFPERFVRDGSGQLVQVDARPIVTRREREERLLGGVELFLPINQSSPTLDAADNSKPDIDRALLFSLPGEVQLSLTHTALLVSEVELKAGTSVIDLLGRNGVGLGGLSKPRHETIFSLGYTERGVGFFLSGQHRGASFLALTDGVARNTLTFSPFLTVGLRAFVDGQRIAPASPWLRGARLSLSLTNLNDARQTVRDDAGQTPLRYQPAYLDPIGRTVLIEVRKAF